MKNNSVIEWSVKEVRLSELKVYVGSVRDYSISDLEKAKSTIEKDGLIEPLVINLDNILIDGELRLVAMLALGLGKCLVTFPSRLLDGDEHSELYLRKNRNIAGIDDYSILRTHFTVEELEDGGFMIGEAEDIMADPSDLIVEEKAKTFLYELVFDSGESKEVANELLSVLRDKYTAEEAVEDNLISFINKNKK